jgi:uncharacterized protein YoxC
VQSKSTRQSYLDQCAGFVTTVEDLLSKQNAIVETKKAQRDAKAAEVQKLVDAQRAYYKAVKEFQDACDLNEKLTREVERKKRRKAAGGGQQAVLPTTVEEHSNGIAAEEEAEVVETQASPLSVPSSMMAAPVAESAAVPAAIAFTAPPLPAANAGAGGGLVHEEVADWDPLSS